LGKEKQDAQLDKAARNRTILYIKADKIKIKEFMYTLSFFSILHLEILYAYLRLSLSPLSTSLLITNDSGFLQHFTHSSSANPDPPKGASVWA
jgi:hypothetical protein